MKRMLTVLAAVMTFCVSADVYKDVLGWYCGAKDLNGDGTFDPGEVRDVRRAGLPDAPSHGVKSTKSETEPKTVAYVTSDVECAVAGVTLKDQQCFDFTPAAYSWSIPLGSQITTAEYTAIIRYRMNETQLDKDGNPSTSAQAYFLNMGYSAANGLMIGVKNDDFGFKGYRGNAGSGISVGIALYSTNDTYKTRGACWNELALVAKPSETAGKTSVTLYFYQPGMKVKTWTKDFDTAQTVPSAARGIVFGAENNTAANTKPYLYFQGKVHMLAYWNRGLSQNEIEEAFRMVPHSDFRRPAVWRIGNEDYGHELFGGAGLTEYTVNAYSQTESEFPSLLADGDKVIVPFTALKRDSGMKQIVRLVAASDSGCANVAVSLDGVNVGVVNVSPGAGANVPLPQALEEGSHQMTFDFADVTGAGVRLDCVELSGSWRLGENDGASEFAGNGGEDDFYVTDVNLGKMRGNVALYTYTEADHEANPSKIPGAIYTDKRVYRIHFNVPADVADRYNLEYRSDTRTASGKPSIPLVFNVNGKTKWEGTCPGTNKDMVFKLKPEDLVAGDNVLEWTTSWTGDDPKQWDGYQDGQHWLGWDYHQLSVLGERKGLILLFR